MEPCLGYPSARSVAYAVKKRLEARGSHQLSARPWNMFDPDNTFWWIVPEATWPAYKHAKLFFSPDRAPAGSLFCGLHLEKGLDPSVASAYSSTGGQRFIMKDDWAWFEFFDDLDSDKFREVLSKASNATGLPVLIRLEAGFVQDPGSFDPQASRPKWDTVVFGTTGGSLDIETAEIACNLLGEVTKSRDLSDLKKSIVEIPNSAWVWLDTFLGWTFKRISPASDPKAWNAEELWSKSLSIWEPWFK